MDLSCDILNQEYKENIRQKMAAITETMCREVFRNAGSHLDDFILKK